MISPIEKILIGAWEANQQANFQILQALTESTGDGLDFDPRESISQAIALQTLSVRKLDEAKTLLNSKQK